ncbi:endoplasmic reticulum lectin 1 isoform X2 [Condylostylus longicornis]|uniref:endoplasmic reticulum lectin 1 isoform X2 n=1 Tax=Condylostylus longicornis TaxID=2530218 RepID=UPI00244E2B01|nr:endoplasmic reticulum lectin 1 isoform X2 [Condylostylus longicornis]
MIINLYVSYLLFKISKMKSILIILPLFCGVLMGQDLKDFDETVLYGIDFPGGDFLFKDDYNYEELIVTTKHQERYKCMIPITETKSEAEKKFDMSKSPLQYLSIMYSKQSCSYRVEAYWTYEICHGYHIKQYHEERDGKQLKSQEYFLGKWDDVKNDELKQKIQIDIESGKKFKTTKIDNINYPYLEVEMTDGTVCDLNNEPRKTKIRYVCYPHRKVEVYSIKETSSCNYEAVVLTTTLCMHPAFVPEESKENSINCLPLEDAPDKPLSWLYNEIDNLKYRPKQLSTTGEMSIDVVENNFEQLGLLEMDFNTEQSSRAIPNEEITSIKAKAPATTASDSNIRLTDNPKQKTFDFLTGKSCLTGGTGWWKFEFCFGKFVRQYHVDKNGETSLTLGIFDKDSHINWIKNNPEKRPKPKNIRTELSHFYHSGTTCEKTGEKRQTEVKLRCHENSPSPTSVSMYLLEPKICQYTLVVESEIFCEIFEMVDDDFGLIQFDKIIPIDKWRNFISSPNYIGNVPVHNFEVRNQND